MITSSPMSRTHHYRICHICCLLLLLCSLLHLAAPGCGSAAVACATGTLDNSTTDNHDEPTAAPDSEEPALLPFVRAFPLLADQTLRPLQLLSPPPPGHRPLIAPPE